MLRTPPRLHLSPLVPLSGLMLSLALGLALGLSACVLPRDPLTGIEVSWSLREREASDIGKGEGEGEGEIADKADALRLRTCTGSLLRRVEFLIEDEEGSSRTATFSYACELGYQTPDEFASLPPDIYVDLRPGDYHLVTRATSEFDGATFETEQDLEVDEFGVTRVVVDLGPALAPWQLDTSGGLGCDFASATLSYAEPGEDLATPPEATATSARYREGLVSDGGLSLPLNGEMLACDGPWAQDQHFKLDPGRYILTIEADDRLCAIPIVVPFAGLKTTLDLAKLPCDG